MTFPDEFWWGAGMPSVITEGAAPTSDLGAWEREGRLPTSEPGNGFASAFADDLGLLAVHGFGHLRLTLDWARLEPTNGHHDAEAIEHLRLVLGVARDAGLSVWGCLHDGPLPGWFAHDERGFRDERSRRYFWARHVEFVGEAFGDLVHGWVPVHEPSRWAMQGWLDGSRPPGGRDDSEAFAASLEAIHLATVEAALRLRGGGRPVASSHWLVPVFPARLDPGSPPTADAEAMASVVDETLRRSWLRMIEEQTLVVPGRAPVEVPRAREAFDVIGFSYRHALAVRGDGALLPYPQTLAVGADGQVAWAEGLAVVLHQLADALPERDLLVTGLGLATDDEARREDHLREALAIASEAVDDGMKLRGLWWDSPIDARSGASAGPGRRGLFGENRDPRPAALLLAKVAEGGPLPT
ncbi:MAG: glycosyl hydrolase family 1 [Acidimicrobiales bacterium]|nr:glycosyl hydrolase family 1 [Acidimicrobiales bacterium]